MADPDKRAVPRQKSHLPLILALLVLAALLGFMLWKFLLPPEEPAVSFTAPPAEGPAYPPPAGDEKRPAPAAPPAEAVLPVGPEEECAIISGRIEDFFTTLEQRDYIRDRQLAEGAQAHFGGLIDRLLANPPVVSGETNDLFTILNNTAHFYRVLQREDLMLVKEVLAREGAELEQLMDLFYRWSLIAPDCPNHELGIHLPLPGLYEYAGFFLNTLGGRSYLFRRENRVQLLAKYYSVLILDQANEAGINRHGLDVRPMINSLLGEIGNGDFLRMGREYLAVLTELQDKYRRQYGQ